MVEGNLHTGSFVPVCCSGPVNRDFFNSKWNCFPHAHSNAGENKTPISYVGQYITTAVAVLPLPDDF